jgi:hypothetical protein
MDPRDANPYQPPSAPTDARLDPALLAGGKPTHPATKFLTIGLCCLVGVFPLVTFSGYAAIGLWIAAFVCGLLALGYGAIGVRMYTGDAQRTSAPISAVFGMILAGVTFALPVWVLSNMSGFAPWGRPLRIRGKVIHAELQPDTAWAEGPAPRCGELDAATRLALATLWHHDAQKEHASVPAFSRVSWLLTGLGAPPELLVRTHGAAVEEIVHARRCFALAGGYAGEPQGAMPIPEILGEGLGVPGDPLEMVALESLRDGCLIEDFNADVAGRAAERASDPAALELVRMIARDERSHAELAWDILAWCLERGGDELRRAVADAAAKLPEQGPGAYSPDDAPLVAAADPALMLAHGRVPAEEWPRIYAARRAATRARLNELLARSETRVRAAA